MMKTRSIVYLTMTLMLALPTVAAANDTGSLGAGILPDGGTELQSVKRLAGWFGAYMELDLHAHQLAELESIVEQQLPPISDLSRQMTEARRDFFAAVEPGENNSNEVRRFAVTQAALYVEMVTKSAHLKADVFGVLNPDQQQKLGEMLGFVDRDGGLGSRTGGP
jgi:Spy/CpxP family protein refolding chaperone